MYVFYYYIIRHYQICVCKIPDSLNTGFDQTVSNLRSLCLWNGKCCDLDIIFPDKGFQIIHRTDLDTADHQSDQLCGLYHVNLQGLENGQVTNPLRSKFV